ncbi:LytTR family DNA-binding domain-containing protein [Heyndrickxia sp. FSL K6-6286]|uniref:LytTR family DNA-binding domain-containing protein n=1 Tax=Heyndrickxia sp. FSL K6-6286 TaxID=2921510 RepID=UPI003159A1AE
MIIVQVDEIYYIGTENRQTYIKTAQHKYETDLLLYQILEKLGDDFLQVHRGYIVNLKQVSAIEPWLNRAYNLILKDGSNVPISRSYAKHVKQKLGIK